MAEVAREHGWHPPKSLDWDENFSIKHDLARLCFQLWPKIGEEGDKISRKKTGEALAEALSKNVQKFVNL